MSSSAPSLAYISSDIPGSQTLREYGRLLAQQQSTGESRLKRAIHGLRLGSALRQPHPRFA